MRWHYRIFEQLQSGAGYAALGLRGCLSLRIKSLAGSSAELAAMAFVCWEEQLPVNESQEHKLLCNLDEFKEIGKLAIVAFKHVWCGNFERLGLVMSICISLHVNPLTATMHMANSTRTAFPNLYYNDLDTNMHNWVMKFADDTIILR